MKLPAMKMDRPHGSVKSAAKKYGVIVDSLMWIVAVVPVTTLAVSFCVQTGGVTRRITTVTLVI